jgi:integrase
VTKDVPKGAPAPGDTRRTIALTLNRLLKIRTSSPIPKGLAPKAGKRRVMAYLYPDEDARLLACKSIPIRERLMWGFLVREGCRVSEALGLRWTDLDLERGAVRLDRNKTDDPRAWALAPGVAAALTHFKGEPSALVFDPPADPLSLAEVLRARLVEAGVKRSELHTAQRGPHRASGS